MIPSKKFDLLQWKRSFLWTCFGLTTNKTKKCISINFLNTLFMANAAFTRPAQRFALFELPIPPQTPTYRPTNPHPTSIRLQADQTKIPTRAHKLRLHTTDPETVFWFFNERLLLPSVSNVIYARVSSPCLLLYIYFLTTRDFYYSDLLYSFSSFAFLWVNV